MFYNTATLAGVPWETLLKLFREQLHDEKKGSLEGYLSAFFSYLESGHVWLSSDMQKSAICISIAKKLLGLIDSKLSNSEVRDALDKEIARVEALVDVPGFDASFIDDILKYYDDEIKIAPRIGL